MSGLRKTLGVDRVGIKRINDFKTLQIWLDKLLLIMGENYRLQRDVVQGSATTVPRGGTGATSFTDGGILLGSGTSAITALGVASKGQIPIGDGATDPVLATLTEGSLINITNDAGSITIAGDESELNALYVRRDGTLKLTANWDAGSYNIRAASLTADGLASGRIVYTGTDGLLSVEGAFAYNDSTNTLKVDTVQTGRLLAGGVQP